MNAGTDKRILVWEVGGATQLCELRGHQDTVYQLVFSRDGSLLASGSGDNSVKLWDVAAFLEEDKGMEPVKWCVHVLYCVTITKTISLQKFEEMSF